MFKKRKANGKFPRKAIAKRSEAAGQFPHALQFQRNDASKTAFFWLEAMFTGLVQAMGHVVATKKAKHGLVLSLHVPRDFKLKLGDSVAVNGTCLTVQSKKGQVISCDCIPETVRLTTMGTLKIGEWVNLERPVTLQTPLGGHLVQGHVDGIGIIKSSSKFGNSVLMQVQVPPKLGKYLVEKGSITVDGVSLTLVDSARNSFTVSLIPTTLTTTTLGRKKPGARVNLEIDILAKLVYQFIHV